jgi:hypothetical protein
MNARPDNSIPDILEDILVDLLVLSTALSTNTTLYYFTRYLKRKREEDIEESECLVKVVRVIIAYLNKED